MNDIICHSSWDHTELFQNGYILEIYFKAHLREQAWVIFVLYLLLKTGFDEVIVDKQEVSLLKDWIKDVRSWTHTQSLNHPMAFTSSNSLLKGTYLHWYLSFQISKAELIESMSRIITAWTFRKLRSDVTAFSSYLKSHEMELWGTCSTLGSARLNWVHEIC